MTDGPFMFEAPITIYHVEWNCGMIEGRFCSELPVAQAFAEMKTVATKRPTTVTPVVVPSFDPARIVLMLNDDDNALEWQNDAAWRVFPTWVYDASYPIDGGGAIHCDYDENRAEVFVGRYKLSVKEFPDYEGAEKWVRALTER